MEEPAPTRLGLTRCRQLPLPVPVLASRNVERWRKRETQEMGVLMAYDKQQYYETNEAGKGAQPRKHDRKKWDKGYDAINWKSRKRKGAK